MKLQEFFESQETVFLEAKEPKLYLGTLRIPLSKADTPNKNKRTYSSALLQREMERMNTKVKEGKIPGMLEHNPKGVIALDKVSHVFTEFSYDKEEGIAYGIAKILSTTRGKDLHTLIKSGVQLGASTVGTGTVGVSGAVLDDFELKSADIVHSPSSQMYIGPELLESLNTALESENKNPQMKAILLQEQRAAGYFEPAKKDEDKKRKIPEGMSAQELKDAGGPGRSIS